MNSKERIDVSKEIEERGLTFGIKPSISVMKELYMICMLNGLLRNNLWIGCMILKK